MPNESPSATGVLTACCSPPKGVTAGGTFAACTPVPSLTSTASTKASAPPLPGQSGSESSVQSATDKSREDLSFLSADGSSLGHTTSSGVERMRLDLEKKTRDELIELGLQLHQLLTQAFRDQHALTRAKARIRHLEKDLETSLAENKTLLAADQSGRALTKTKLDDGLQFAAELVEQNYRLKARVNTLQATLDLNETSCPLSKQRPKMTRSAVQAICVLSSQTSSANVETAATKPLLTLDTNPVVTATPCSGRFPGCPPPFKGITLKLSKPEKPDISKGTTPACFSNLMASMKQRFKQSNKTDCPPLPSKPPLVKRVITPQQPQHRRVQLYWPPTGADSPPRVAGRSTQNVQLLTDGLEDNGVLSQSVTETCLPERLSHHLGSIFDPLPDPNDIQVLSELQKDSRLDEWFTKKPNEHTTKKLKTKALDDAVATMENSKRVSVLGSAASQKYLITVRCLKKDYDADNGWESLKRSMRHCTLTKSQINLLLETVPDRDAAQGSRKLQEWEEHVAKVQALKKQNCDTTLYEDEEFVFYIASVPDLHQRLQCMLIMDSFPDLLKRLNADIEALMDAMEVLLKSSGVRRLFHAILYIGNHQNEGTSLADRKWFRMGTLKRVMDFRGTGRDAKSLLTFLAIHLGPILSPEECGVIARAAQISIVHVIQTATQIHDIFKLLNEEALSTVTPAAQPENKENVEATAEQDHFTAIGRQFVQQHRERYQELRQDIRRLLEDYHCCVTYFGDPEAFLPLDKKVDDERNPGQKRFIQDLFLVFHELLTAFRLALRDVQQTKVKRPRLKSSSALVGEVPALPQHEGASDMMPLAAKEPAAPAEHVSSSNVPSFCSSSVLHDSALTKSDDTSPKEEFIQKLNSTPIELPAPREIISLSSVSSSVVSSSTVEDNTSRLPVEDNTKEMEIQPLNTSRCRASLRPSLFPSTSVLPHLDRVVGTLEGIQELVNETDECTATRVAKSQNSPKLETLSNTAPSSTSASFHVNRQTATATLHSTVSASSDSTGVAAPTGVRRRRESLRAVAGFLSSINPSSDLQFCSSSLLSRHPTPESQAPPTDDSCKPSSYHPGSEAAPKQLSLLTSLRSRPAFQASRSLLQAHRNSLLRPSSEGPPLRSETSATLSSSVFAHSTSLLAQRLAAKRFTSSLGKTVLEPLQESTQEEEAALDNA